MFFDKPNNNIGEITILGTGGGYGESCIIHLGNQQWVVVDSCINPTTKESLPLQYLTKIGVNVESQVKLILCSHWHDDHILGLSQLLSRSNSAIFSTAKTTDKQKFLLMLTLDYKKRQKGQFGSSTKEFYNCLQTCNKLNLTKRFSFPDRTLYSFNCDGFDNQIISLSPSDKAIENFDLDILTPLLKDSGCSNLRILKPSPNYYCVALLVKIGYHRAILGADLEVSRTDKLVGWDDIVINSQCFDKKAKFFKIPHHGSVNAYHNDLWETKLDVKTTASITPWNKGTKLPKQEMIEVYKERSNELYITSNSFSNKPKKRNRFINKLIDDFNIPIYEVKYKFGLIRARIDMSDSTDEWQIDCSGSACKL